MRCALNEDQKFWSVLPNKELSLVDPGESLKIDYSHFYAQPDLSEA